MSQSLGQQSKQGLTNLFTNIDRGLGYLPDPNFTPRNRTNNASNNSGKKGTTFTSSDGSTTYTTLPDGRTVYGTGGQNYDRKTGQQVIDHKGTTGGTSTYVHKGPFSIDSSGNATRHSAAPAPVAPNAETEVHDSPKKAAVTGPVSSDTRTNAAGVTQTGRNLGAIRMDLGAAEAYVGGKISPFSSQPLPETKGYLSNFPADSGSARYSGEVNNVDLAGYGNLAKTEVPFHQSPDLGGIGEKINASSANFFAGTSGSSAAKGESDGKSKTDYSDFGGSDPMSYATSNEEARRRSRFLDNDDVMQGLKNIQADQGIVYAGGQHYANTGKGEKAFSKIGSDTVRGIMNSAPEKANELKNSYIAGLKKENTLASANQNPAESFSSGNTTTDGIAERVEPQHKVDFNLNNTNPAEDFLNPPNLNLFKGNSKKFPANFDGF